MKQFLIFAIASLLSGSAYKVSAQTPLLNSYPGATATIYLDFDGQSINSPYWNSGVPFYCTSPNFTSEQITTIFNRVADDFSPFKLNITTDSTVYFATASTKRQRIIVTAYSTWYGSAGGVAYIESFRWGMEIPGFVFANLLNYNVKNVAEAISHETGHTLGLSHQSKYDASCNFVGEYNPGGGTGETSWAPIMGNSYGKSLTLWHKGSTNAGCNSVQDDLAILASNSNGFGYRTDDIGNSVQQSTPVAFTSNAFAITGEMNSASDIDMMKVTFAQPQRFSVSASGLNSDLLVTVTDNKGNIINSYNPPASTSVLFDTTFNAGTYYLSVTNVGNTNTTTYGMLGSYTLNGSLPTTALPIHNMNLSGAVVNNKHNLNWDIIADEPIESITIETSADGKNFNNLQNVSSEARRFEYQPTASGNQYYRLFVVTASQLKYYSNVISLREVARGEKYILTSNIIRGNNISLNSTGSYNWRLVDMNGRNVSTGKINTGFNQLNTGSLTNGMYLLQIIDGAVISTEKIVKQ
ncbi:MAG: T9SS type A sorting domain-containing protein [Lacibacter sp.]